MLLGHKTTTNKTKQTDTSYKASCSFSNCINDNNYLADDMNLLCDFINSVIGVIKMEYIELTVGVEPISTALQAKVLTITPPSSPTFITLS